MSYRLIIRPEAELDIQDELSRLSNHSQASTTGFNESAHSRFRNRLSHTAAISIRLYTSSVDDTLVSSSFVSNVLLFVHRLR